MYMYHYVYIIYTFAYQQRNTATTEVTQRGVSEWKNKLKGTTQAKKQQRRTQHPGKSDMLTKTR